jgi:catechol 2,3-dioxygenase-like lactoylglutathione lyase family enzyme
MMRTTYLACLVAVSAGALVASVQLRAGHAAPATSPTLINTCLITANVDYLVSFYESVLQMKAQRTGEDYAEFHTGVGVLAIFSAEAQEKYIPGSADAAKNKSAILEFRVIDVDQEYARLQPSVKTWVKPPTTQPWGTRSIYFRDPDGNLVDFYVPAPAR